MQIKYVPLFALYAFVLLTAFACSTAGPVKEAETVEQHAFALYGTYVIYQQQAAELMGREQVPDSVKRKIQEIDARAHPIARSVSVSAREVLRVRREFEAGRAEEGVLLAALRNAERWTNELRPVLAEFLTAIEGVRE